MWIFIILLLIVLYFIGKNENAKKNNEKSSQTQEQTKANTAQKKRSKAYDAETKRLYNYILSDCKDFLKYDLRNVPFMTKVKLKKQIKEEIERVKTMQKTDQDGTKIREHIIRFKPYMESCRGLASSTADLHYVKKYKKAPPRYSSPSYTQHTQTSYSQPTYSSVDYYAESIKRREAEEESQAREMREYEISRMKDQIDSLHRKGAVIEEHEMKKKLEDFERRGF